MKQTKILCDICGNDTSFTLFALINGASQDLSEKSTLNWMFKNGLSIKIEPVFKKVTFQETISLDLCNKCQRDLLGRAIGYWERCNEIKAKPFIHIADRINPKPPPSHVSPPTHLG